MAKPSILAVLEHYQPDGRLQHRGLWTPMRCPFHDDRKASASYNEEYEVFTCHACGIHGDAYAVIMQFEGVGFPEAKRLVQEWAGTAYDAVSGGAESGRSLLPSWTRNRRRRNRALSHG